MTSRAPKTECDCASKKAEWDLHPQVNRTLSNQLAGSDPQGHVYHHDQSSQQVRTEQANATKGVCQCGKNEWDLHPAVIRKIENEGSDADVKQLHDLEHECPGAGKTH